MNILIIKIGATGDVVRTTPLLRRWEGNVTWVTSTKNCSLLEGVAVNKMQLRVVPWEKRDSLAGKSYNLAINLEDDLETAALLKAVHCERLFGAFGGENGAMKYTDDAHEWFDLSLISIHGREKADALKLQNRRTYQDLVFGGLGLDFRGDQYLLPPTGESPLRGDVAIAPEAGAVWPMKKWAHFNRLKAELEARGLRVNELPVRPTLLEHLADIRGHRCLVSGDSLPMHLALGSGVKCVALFNCTSPWEIYDYGLLAKIVSPLLGEFFYKRGFDARATTAIHYGDVLNAVLAQLE